MDQQLNIEMKDVSGVPQVPAGQYCMIARSAGHQSEDYRATDNDCWSHLDPCALCPRLLLLVCFLVSSAQQFIHACG